MLVRVLGEDAVLQQPLTGGARARLAPPLTITDAEADWLLERLLAVLGDGLPLRLAQPLAASPQRPASFAA